MNPIARLAEERTREVLLTQPHIKQVVLDSPPGAGKTGVVERLAIQSAWIHNEQVMIATQTNGQSFDLARRLSNGWPNHPVLLLTRKGLPVPEDLEAQDNLQVISSLKQLPDQPLVVIGNASKWGYVHPEDANFDLMLVDEAYQLRDSQFAQIAGMAKRHVLVGDPGQIAPVVTVSTTRWHNMLDGPHVPAPQALLHRRPEATLRMMLPASRRLPHDTVETVQPVFYPDLPFQAASNQEDRKLLVEPNSGHAWDAVIDRSAQGASLVIGEMPERITGEFDSELAGEIVQLVERLFERSARTLDDGTESALTPEQIGVVCAHRSQVYAVQERLSAEGFQDVYVETADRYQGLERKVMIVHHPLSGRISLSDFQMDLGRFCVMLSRHRIACFVVCRAGIQEKLEEIAPPVSRILGANQSVEGAGRNAHQRLFTQMREDNRIIEVLGDSPSEPMGQKETNRTSLPSSAKPEKQPE